MFAVDVPCTVVCLSASDGAAGEAIAPIVADRLRFRIVDEHVIARAAAEAGVAAHVAAEVEQRRSLAARLLDHLPGAGIAAGTSGLMGLPAVDFDDVERSRENLRTLIRNARKEQAESKPPKAYREIFQILKDLAKQSKAADASTDAGSDDEEDADEE